MHGSGCPSFHPPQHCSVCTTMGGWSPFLPQRQLLSLGGKRKLNIKKGIQESHWVFSGKEEGVGATPLFLTME